MFLNKIIEYQLRIMYCQFYILHGEKIMDGLSWQRDPFLIIRQKSSLVYSNRMQANNRILFEENKHIQPIDISYVS